MSDEAFSADTINHDVGLLDKQTYRVFNDKLTFKYVEIAKFKKNEAQLVTNFDKWLYVLRNLSRLDAQPSYLKNEVFNRLFKAAEIAHFSKTELREYEDSLKAYRDIKNSLDSAEAKGIEKGLAEGLAKGRAEGMIEGEEKKAREIAGKMKSNGIPVDVIMQMTGLSEEEISSL